jgi:hypothetical protein
MLTNVAYWNIKAYEGEITTKVQASAVKGIDQAIFKELNKLQPSPATSGLDRLFLQGMETSLEKRKRRSSSTASTALYC